MNVVRVSRAEDLLITYARQYFRCGHYYFRGVADPKHILIPSLARQDVICGISSMEERAQREESMLRDFKARSRALLQHEPNDEWEWLALAQHHRLPTRLLDWSSSLLVGLYFACERILRHDGTFAEYRSDSCALYALHAEKLVRASDVCENPFKCDKVGIVGTAQVTNRMIGQSGLFSIQPDPYSALETQFENSEKKKWIVKFIIPHHVREELFLLLHTIGVRPASIYADLDGLSGEIRQMQELGCSMTEPPGNV